MRKTNSIYILTLIILLTSCNFNKEKKDSVWSELPEVTQLNSLKNTEFAITLENQILENKNIIYAPVFLFAWNALKSNLETPFKITEPSSNDLKLLNNSISYEKALNPEEYNIDYKVEELEVSAYAYFNKTLPFPHTLEKMEDPILFNNTKVNAFGMNNYNMLSVDFTEILYYKNDDNFILKFLPKNGQNEIILIKGIDSVSTLSEMLKKMNHLIDLGKMEQKKSDISWKYMITEDDMFSVPIIKFNIATNYNNIENQKFKAGDTDSLIKTAFQRTGFILNETGAVIESDAIVQVISAAMEEEERIKHPKKMIFDKTFYIVMKHIDTVNPYFVMKVDNVELMSKK